VYGLKVFMPALYRKLRARRAAMMRPESFFLRQAPS
jgi:hypothetical protein